MSDSITPIDYVLGELDPGDRAEAERRLRDDDGFRREVERLRPVVGRLQSLPPQAWSPPEPPPLRMPREPRARRGRLWGSLSPRPLVAVAAACALLAVGVVAGLLVGSRGPDTPAGPELTLRPLTAEASAGGTARVRGTDPGTLEVTVHGLEATGDDRFYELWLMDSGARNLVSLGSFAVPASGAATVQVPLPADVTRFGYVDLSLEPADGDPAHSGDSVLRGATS